MIIGIIGQALSGKGTLAKHLHEKYGADVYNHSDILYEILSMLSLPVTRENAIKLAELRKLFGDDVLINALNKRIGESKSKLIVVAGIRFPNELDNIWKYPENSVWYIVSPLDSRYARQRQRAERADDNTMSYAEFLDMESRRTEIGIEALGEKADHVIDNSGTLEDFYAKADEIVSGLSDKIKT